MDNKEKSPEKELIESIGLMIEKGMESNTNIYTGVVKSVDGKRAVVAVNGQNQNVSIATANVSSGNVVRVFVPEGNMSAAFIIKAEASGGGETTTTAYGDLTGKPQINGVTLIDNKTSKELNLYGTGNAPPYPVTSVNGQTGDVTIDVGGNVNSVNGKTGVVVLSAADVGALPNTTVIPDKTSQLDNDSGYITNSALTGYAKKTEIPTKTSELTNDSGYITNVALEPYAKTVDIPTKTSQLNNDSGYITANDVPVKSVDGATGDVVTNAVKTTTQTLTDTQKQQARTNIGAGTSSFDGDYNSLTNKPTIPTKTSQLTNDSGFITDAALTGYAKTTDIPTKTSQLDNDSHYITVSEAPVQSVNSKTGDVQLNASDVGALPDTTVIPSKTSQLDNDSGFITDIPIASTTQLGGVKIGAGLSVTENGVLSATGGGTADAVEWNNVLDKPTTIVGYGITDAKIENGTITLGNKTITPLTSAPVTSVNSKTGSVVLGASDVGAISTDNISQTLGTSTTKVPSEKAVSDALSSAGAGDMLKSTYDPTGSVATAGGIPEYVEANGGKIDTIKVNGTVQAISDKTVNITVPTKTSDITNDSGYLTSVPVTSVNSKTGAVVLTANDVGALPADTVIPTVNNATLTIRRNSVDVGSFTSNSANDVNIDINVPTDKSDIGLGNVDNVKQYSASNPPPYPVTSVNGNTGAVNLTASDIGAATASDIYTALNRTNAVDVANSNYTTYMARGEALFASETTPTVNGCIAWKYE